MHEEESEGLAACLERGGGLLAVWSLEFWKSSARTGPNFLLAALVCPSLATGRYVKLAKSHKKGVAVCQKLHGLDRRSNPLPRPRFSVGDAWVQPNWLKGGKGDLKNYLLHSMHAPTQSS